MANEHDILAIEKSYEMELWFKNQEGRAPIIDAMRKNPVTEVWNWLDYKFDEMPEAREIESVMTVATESLQKQNELHSGYKRELNVTRETIVVSDIHANPDFLRNLFNQEVEYDGQKYPLLEAIKNHRVNLVFVGDIVHSEGADMDHLFNIDPKITEPKERYKGKDLARSTNAMLMLASLQASFPMNVTVLRGNHEDILGQNIPDRYNSRANKIYKGEIDITGNTTAGLYQVYSSDKPFDVNSESEDIDIAGKLITLISKYENLLPLVALSKGRNPLILSHSAIGDRMSNENFNNPDKHHFALTAWTDNNEYNPQELIDQAHWTAEQLGVLANNKKKLLSFFGHRLVPNGQKYLSYHGQMGETSVSLFQLHRSHRGAGEQRIAKISPYTEFNPEIHIIDVNPKNNH